MDTRRRRRRQSQAASLVPSVDRTAARTSLILYARGRRGSAWAPIVAPRGTPMSYRSGRHFLQIPGPTNVPDRVLRAIDMPTMDHRGPEFGALGLEVLDGLQHVFQTRGHVVIYPASGTGAWEAALVNTLSPGDKVLMFETGHFATLWNKMATKLGLQPEFVATDWRRGADPAI